MIITGVILIISGYFLLFSVPSDASTERVFRQAISGMGLSIIGAIIIMFNIFNKSR